jgi:N-methylhydantoinase B/oxoprolinase/acetone carboxylase alpha subunit
MATETRHSKIREATLEPTLLAVLANRFEAIVREMTQTLLRAGRSAAINIARDFSCSITTSVMGQHELLAAAEGLPVHIYGSHLQAQAMCDLHPDLREGDAFLHNDPYLGNSHPADHTILVPILWEGEHLFTAVSKAHLSDIGNALPTSYMPYARDVYEEGALLSKGVQGGLSGSKAWAVKIDREGNETPLPNIFAGEILPGEFIRSCDCGGGGYGPPIERDPERVRRDVLERWVSLEQARALYGVIFTGSIDDETFAVDGEATQELRERLRRVCG